MVLRHQAAGHRRSVEGYLGYVDEPLELRRSPGEENASAGKDYRTLCGGEHLHGFADGAGLGRRPAAFEGAGRPDGGVLFDLLVDDVGADIDVDRAGPGRRGLPEGRADDLRVPVDRRGSVPVLAQGLHYRDLVDLLEGVASRLVHLARTAQDHHRRAVDRRRVDAGKQVQGSGARHACADPRPARNAGVGVRREGGGLLVPEVDRPDTQVVTGEHDVPYGTSRQVEEGIDTLLLESPCDQVAA